MFAYFHVLRDTAQLKVTYNDRRIVLHPQTRVRQTHAFMVHGNGFLLIPSHVVARPGLGASYLIGELCFLLFKRFMCGYFLP